MFNINMEVLDDECLTKSNYKSFLTQWLEISILAILRKFCSSFCGNFAENLVLPFSFPEPLFDVQEKSFFLSIGSLCLNEN